MIGGLISLASYGMVGSGGEIGNLLFRLEQMGVFAYLLPFLLIFAIVYGILTRVQLLGNNPGINLVLSLAIGLMALQFNFVAVFFSEIFPRLGVGLSIVLVAMIFLGAFTDFKENKWIKWVFFGLGALIALIVIFQSLGSSFTFGNWGTFGGLNYFFNTAGKWIILIAAVVILMVVIVKSGKNNTPPASP
jgi:hypothetical protein